MKFFSTRNALKLLAAISFAFVANSVVQAAPGQQAPAPAAQPSAPSGGQDKAAPAPPPKLNPKEEADYKTFAAVSPSDASKKIQLGQQFLQNYPGTRYEEAVENQLVDAYYTTQDWNSFYAVSARVIEKDPDDVDALTVVGWVIPHLYNADDPDKDKKLSKAEAYEKHAIELLATIQKPANLTDQQFAEARSQKLIEAHSGLGLVYFRQQDFDNATKELQLATNDNPMPDATDLYVLGVSLQQSNKNPEAANAFTKCSQIPGPLQDRCKQSAATAKSAK
jgi:tetratricopeptide (TPR) repeat protein